MRAEGFRVGGSRAREDRRVLLSVLPYSLMLQQLMHDSERRGGEGRAGSWTLPGSGEAGVGPRHPDPPLTFSFLLSSNFSNYKARFNMPGDSEGLWYR